MITQVLTQLGFIKKRTYRGKRLIPVRFNGRLEGWILTERRPVRSIQWKIKNNFI